MSDAELIRRARESDVFAVARQRATLKRVSSAEFAGPCPRCGGRDRFAVNTRKQAFNCRGCGAHGDVIALVQFLDDIDFKMAVKRLTGGRWRPLRTVAQHIAADLGKASPDPPQGDDEAKRLKHAGAVWNEAGPVGPEGEAYLARRGIFLDDVPDHGGLRWHSRCPWGVGTAPCLIARFTDAVTAEPRGIWRRPVVGEKPKALGPTAGCVIRLWPDVSVELGLVLGEGVETTLAAATRITHRGTLLQPAWAAGSSGNMASFPVLAGVEALTLLVDHDANGAGERAAEQCASRWADARKEVIRLIPGDLGDFNDLLLR